MELESLAKKYKSKDNILEDRRREMTLPRVKSQVKAKLLVK